MRPICSTIQWYSRPVQKILYYILKTYFGGVLCPNNVLRVSEVAQFVNHLAPKPAHVFVKFDVTDMYGSLDKGRICVLLERILDQIEVEGLSILPTELVIRMLRFSLRQSCLVGYQDKVYVQTNGLPQGACDSGFLATLYLDYILQLHYEELFVAHRVHYWAKYMDDFLLYMPTQYIEFFKLKYEFLTGLKLEIEPEEVVSDGALFSLGVRRTIPFLDISVHTLEDGSYATSSYRKPTTSMRTLHALSNTVYSYKVNTTYAYITNILRRTSTGFLIHDILKLHERLLMNGYSHNFVERITYKAIDGEIQKLQNLGSAFGDRDKAKRISVLRGHLKNYLLDEQNHYQIIREQHVAFSRNPGYIFPYRSVSLSRLIFTACQIVNMPPPIFSRAKDTDVFRRYLGHHRIQAILETYGHTRPNYNYGMLSCITCSMVFVVSARGTLNQVVSEEFLNPNSTVVRHQEDYQHTVSPAVQPLRSICGVDTAYMCQLYLAIFNTIGCSTSNLEDLSRFPVFVPALINILRSTGALWDDDEGVNQPKGSQAATQWLTTIVPYLPTQHSRNGAEDGG